MQASLNRSRDSSSGGCGGEVDVDGLATGRLSCDLTVKLELWAVLELELELFAGWRDGRVREREKEGGGLFAGWRWSSSCYERERGSDGLTF